jgi:hypothetical protein
MLPLISATQRINVYYDIFKYYLNNLGQEETELLFSFNYLIKLILQKKEVLIK